MCAVCSSNENNSLILVQFWHTSQMRLDFLQSYMSTPLHMRTYHINLGMTNNKSNSVNESFDTRNKLHIHKNILCIGLKKVQQYKLSDIFCIWNEKKNEKKWMKRTTYEMKLSLGCKYFWPKSRWKKSKNYTFFFEI